MDLYQQQLKEKAEQLKFWLIPFYQGAIEVFPSASKHYRMRAEFSILHEGDKAFYAMHQGPNKTLEKITSFLIGSKLINTLMPLLKSLWDEDKLLRHRLFRVDFLTSLKGEALITLCYHKKLDEAWLESAHKASQKLGITLIGRAKKQKLATGSSVIKEEVLIHGQKYFFIQNENGFSQPNAQVNEKMIAWMVDCLVPGQDLLELYCGNGNFTLPFSRKADKILATEVNKHSIAALKENMILNNATNIACARLSAAEISDALSKRRSFKRLKDIDLSSYHFHTIFVDPPRAGVDQTTCEMMHCFQQILYMSCQPLTLLGNLKELTLSHRVIKVALFDQFPFTPHMEVGLSLVSL